jgi:hypothetical protein
MFVKDTA